MVKATLHIGDLSFNVLEFEHTISKQAAHDGFPTSKAGFKGLNVIVEESGDNTFWEYGIADDLPMPKVVLETQPAILGQGPTRYMYLYDCHVVYHKTKFTSDTEVAAYHHVTITCQGLEMSTSKTVYQTLWRKTFPNDAVTTTVRETDPIGTVTDMHFTNIAGEKLNKLQPGQDVTCVIQSRDLVDDTISLDFSNYGVGFEYEGQPLAGNSLEDTLITADTMRIPLKTLKKY